MTAVAPALVVTTSGWPTPRSTPMETYCRGLDSRGVVWAGNKIEYVVSDTVSAAFQYEIRLDQVVSVNLNGQPRAEGAIQLDQSLQSMFGGIYLPIPPPLERFLVPSGDCEIRLELMPGNLIDMRTAKHWMPKEATTQQ